MATGVFPDSQRSDVLPVFVQQRSLPNERDKPYTVREICGTCEKKTGHDTIIGAQRLGSLWRIYPRSNATQAKLLLSGFSLRGVSVTPCDKNPFIIRTSAGEREVKTTRLTVGNIPISYSNSEIEEMIVKLGGKPRSALFMERDRDDSGHLTRWLTGRRFMYIEVPETPLPSRVELGPFKPTLFHFEQRVNRELKCGRCLELGHGTSSCVSDVTCFDCGKAGHKRGSPSCTHIDSTTEKTPTNEEIPSGSDAIDAIGQQEKETSQPRDSPQHESVSPSTLYREPRAPRANHQTKLPFGRRARSYTPSRKRPPTSPPPVACPGKRRDTLSSRGDEEDTATTGIDTVAVSTDTMGAQSEWG